jgi:[acyl-carrier-protein] S-malonyltransferase
MGKDFCDSYPLAKETFQEADEILKRNLSSVIFNGPQTLLTETRNSQTAIFVMSVALLRVIQKLYPDLSPFCCAGLSLGEYTALYGAKRIAFAECLTLVDKRGQLMSDACEKNKGTMAVIIGLTAQQVEEIVKECNMPNDLCAANFNTPDQVVISGTARGVEAGSALAKTKGAKMVMPLAVHGAFHSCLMRPAEEQLRPYIENTTFLPGQIPVVMNFSGKMVVEIPQLKEQLIKQVTSPVRWEQGIKGMIDQGVDCYIEIGCGKTLTGMNKKIGTPGKSISIEKIADLESLEAIHSAK